MRSSVPGRQRWEVGGIRDRREAARRVESELGARPGIVSVSANPVTGRVLVHHDGTLTEAQVGAWLRAATEPARPAQPEESARAGVSAGAAVGLGAAALGVTLLPGGALLGLGAVVVATGLVVRSAWRDLGGVDSARPPAETLSRAVGARTPQVASAAACSALGQVALLALSATTTSGMALLLTGEMSTLTALGITGTAAQLATLVGALAVLGAAVGALSYAAARRWRRLGADIEQDWRESTYRHVQQVELRHIEQEGPARIAAILSDDAAQLGRLFSGSGADVVQAATAVLVLVPTFLFLEPAIAWAAVLPIPVIAWLSVRFHRRNSANLARTHAATSALREHLASRIEGNATVKAFTAEEHEAREVERLGAEARSSRAVSDRSGVLYAETVQFGAISTMVGMLAVGGRAVLDGSLPFPVFSATLGLPQNLIIRLPRLAPTIEAYQAASGALDRLERLRGLPVESLTVGARPEWPRGELLLDDVTFAYPGDAPVLRELSLRIAPGRVTAIVGPTGSGKSTIAGLLVRLRDADAGRVLLDGVDVRELSLHGVRDAIAFVSQESRIFDGTVAENIRYGSAGASSERVADAARRAAADGFIRSLPDGYDTVIGSGGRILSGGQRQRLALARAMLKPAPIMVLDEATSAVDNGTEAAIGEALARAGHRTRLVIAHRLSLVRHADWIYVLDDGGALVEAGTHDGLVEQGGRYAALWHLQVGAGTV